MPIAAAAQPLTAVTDVTKLQWDIVNVSYIDEDTGFEYLEITNSLTMPILSTDNITFHVEYFEGTTVPTSGLLRDGFECIVSKE